MWRGRSWWRLGVGSKGTTEGTRRTLAAFATATASRQRTADSRRRQQVSKGDPSEPGSVGGRGRGEVGTSQNDGSGRVVVGVQARYGDSPTESHQQPAPPQTLGSAPARQRRRPSSRQPASPAPPRSQSAGSRAQAATPAARAERKSSLPACQTSSAASRGRQRRSVALGPSWAAMQASPRRAGIPRSPRARPTSPTEQESQQPPASSEQPAIGSSASFGPTQGRRRKPGQIQPG